MIGFMKQQSGSFCGFLCINVFIFLLQFVLAVGSVQGAPKAELWAYWNRAEKQSQNTVDHSTWQHILDRYLKVDGYPEVTLFAYDRVSSADRTLLDDYVQHLATTDVFSLSSGEQKAFWINLYNALTVQLVLNHYPVETIRDIRFGFFSFGPWNEKLLTIKNKELSLNDIEHRILRPIWKDPRIHYAVNCASIGCPNLSAKTYSGVNVEKLLEQAAQNYVNHSRGVEFEGDTLRLSSIYDWYKIDFGNSDVKLIQHLMQYARPSLRSRLSGHEGGAEYHYDWALNSP